MDDEQEQRDQNDQGFPNNEALDINEVKALEETVKRLHDENKVLIKRSEHMTRFMAKNAHGMKGIENLNDPHSNTKLAERFEGIFHDLWTKVLKHEQQKTELQSIKWLSSLMKRAHCKCVSLANDKIRNFAFLEEGDSLPLRSDHPDLYSERAALWQTEKAMKTVKQKIADELFINELTNNMTDEPLKHFLDKFVDCCWLMLVSAKPFVFTFDVVGQVLEGDLERQFAVHCSTLDLKDKTKKNGEIVELVWPEIDDNDGIQMKGEVLVIDNEDTDTDEADENVDVDNQVNNDNIGAGIGRAAERHNEPTSPTINRGSTSV